MEELLVGGKATRQSIDKVNRATREGFLAYMMARPVYFEDLTGRKASEEEVSEHYDTMLSDGLVCATSLPLRCEKCRKEAVNCAACGARKIRRPWR